MTQDTENKKEFGPQKLFRLLLWTALISSLIILTVAGLGISKVYEGYVIRSAETNAVNISQSLAALKRELLVHEAPSGEQRVNVYPSDFEELNATLLKVLVPYNIIKIKVFTPEGIIVYSSEQKLIGENDSKNPRLQKALAGLNDSKMMLKDKIADLRSETRLNIDLVETYVPVYDRTGKGVIGAFEIYQDMTPHRAAVKRGVKNSLGILAGILVLVFGLASLVVVKAGRALGQAQQELHKLATQDSLTGLANRGEIMQCINQEAARLKRLAVEKEATRFSLIMGDVDKFKSINDTYGHPAGDVVLKQVAAIMKEQVREYDRVGRYGGEEFLVLLPATDFNHALVVAERIRKSIETTTVETEKGELRVTISLGVSTVKPEESDVQDALKRADEGLYMAKAGGRNRVSWLPEEEDKS